MRNLDAQPMYIWGLCHHSCLCLPSPMCTTQRQLSPRLQVLRLRGLLVGRRHHLLLRPQPLLGYTTHVHVGLVLPWLPLPTLAHVLGPFVFSTHKGNIHQEPTSSFYIHKRPVMTYSRLKEVDYVFQTRRFWTQIIQFPMQQTRWIGELYGIKYAHHARNCVVVVVNASLRLQLRNGPCGTCNLKGQGPR